MRHAQVLHYHVIRFNKLKNQRQRPDGLFAAQIPLAFYGMPRPTDLNHCQECQPIARLAAVGQKGPLCANRLLSRVPAIQECQSS